MTIGDDHTYTYVYTHHQINHYFSYQPLFLPPPLLQLFTLSAIAKQTWSTFAFCTTFATNGTRLDECPQVRAQIRRIRYLKDGLHSPLPQSESQLRVCYGRPLVVSQGFPKGRASAAAMYPFCPIPILENTQNEYPTLDSHTHTATSIPPHYTHRTTGWTTASGLLGYM